jgi:hypothetical protein
MKLLHFVRNDKGGVFQRSPYIYYQSKRDVLKMARLEDFLIQMKGWHVWLWR